MGDFPYSLKKTTKNICQHSWYLERDSKPDLTEKKQSVNDPFKKENVTLQLRSKRGCCYFVS